MRSSSYLRRNIRIICTDVTEIPFSAKFPPRLAVLRDKRQTYGRVPSGAISTDEHSIPMIPGDQSPATPKMREQVSVGCCAGDASIGEREPVPIGRKIVGG
ncbi:MAG: hypothetical protein ABIH23_10725 [bacterium]